MLKAHGICSHSHTALLCTSRKYGAACPRHAAQRSHTASPSDWLVGYWWATQDTPAQTAHLCTHITKEPIVHSATCPPPNLPPTLPGSMYGKFTRNCSCIAAGNIRARHLRHKILSNSDRAIDISAQWTPDMWSAHTRTNRPHSTATKSRNTLGQRTRTPHPPISIATLYTTQPSPAVPAGTRKQQHGISATASCQVQAPSHNQGRN